MDPIRNPYAPGAGTPPPELAGRREILDAARLALARTRIGRFEKSLILVGLRGVGKTVLLDRIARLARGEGYLAELIEATEDKPLVKLLFPALRKILVELDRFEKISDRVKSGWRVLKSFLSSFKIEYEGFELVLTLSGVRRILATWITIYKTCFRRLVKRRKIEIQQLQYS